MIAVFALTIKLQTDVYPVAELLAALAIASAGTIYETSLKAN